MRDFEAPRLNALARPSRFRGWLACLTVVLLCTVVSAPPSVAMTSDELTADDVLAMVREVWDKVRGKTSYGEVTMVIHRPDWERTMSMKAWTSGSDNSLVRVTEPRKDAGSGTLTLDEQMWTFSPKINRVIKVPSSMMGQSWMGSDFSNKDVSRSDDIVDKYTHRLVGTKEHEGKTVYVVESTPHEEAAVVWGQEVLEIRDDAVLLRQDFYDQDMELVKSLVSLDIGKLGGRMMATRQRMSKVDTPEEWTEISFDTLTFDVDLEDWVFTQSNLRNPRN